MPDLYTLSETNDGGSRGPRITLLTVVGVLFLGFMFINVGLTIVDTQEDLESRRLHPDDRIEYHYTVTTEDGTLLETSMLETAQRANRTQGFPVGDESGYAPQRATLNPANPGLGWGVEAEERVLAAHVGETVRVRTEGGDDWQSFPPDGLTRRLGPEPFQRDVFLQEPEAAQAEDNPGTPNFDLDALDEAIGRVESGTVYNAEQMFPPSWDIVFEDVNRDNRSVLLHHTVQHGQYFDVEGLPGGITVVLEENETRLFYRVDLEEGAMFVLGQDDPLLQSGFQPGSYRVREVTEDRVRLEHNESLDPTTIGQPVVVEIRILERVQN